MHSTTFLASIAVISAGMATSSPVHIRDTSDRFLLKTEVIPVTNHTDCGSNKDNLYIQSFHTGAGTGVAAGTSSMPSGLSNSWFYLNGSELLFTYPNNDIGPSAVNVELGSAYQTFSTVSISPSESPSSGWSVNNTFLTAAGSSGFLACDWWFADSPQIFSINQGFYNATNFPSSCSLVGLIPQPAS